MANPVGYNPMANYPGSMGTLPSADPPYRVCISKEGTILIETDNVGRTFKIIGDKYLAAQALLETVIVDGSKWRNITGEGPVDYRMGAFKFIFQDSKLIDIGHYYTSEACIYTPSLIEKRPEVFELIELMKTMIKLKAFL